MAFLAIISKAQEGMLKVNIKYNDNKSLTISFEKQDLGTHTLVSILKSLKIQHEPCSNNLIYQITVGIVLL